MKRKKIIFLLLTLFLFITNSTLFTNLLSKKNNPSLYNDEYLRNSFFKWATLELTNPSEINESIFNHNSIISIKGRIYSKADGTNKSNIETILQINNITYPNYNDTTNLNGKFTINYVIDPNLDIYSFHEIKVIPVNYVTDPPDGYIENPDYYIIDVQTTSNFQITSHDNRSIPKLTEEIFFLNGTLYYGNGTGISNARVNYTWISGGTTVSGGYFYTDSSGALVDVQVPITTVSQLTLKLNFSQPSIIDYSEFFIYNIKVFSDVAWDLDIVYTIMEGDNYTLTGTLFSSTDSSLRINDREIEIYYNGTLVTTTPDEIITASNGNFSARFQTPERNGTASLQIRLLNSAGKNIRSPLQTILVEAIPLPIPRTTDVPPFLIFSIIFFPILAVIVAGLVVFGIFYYKKREVESRVVNLPLESRIKNLKILKNTGRLEESISYLFNAIYMDLINAKYSRSRKVNETIRDFAIISVKELKLTPASIYPFIQKVEEIIYAKPFKITDQDFYGTCELFSPIYFQLTGYNFVLNF